MARLAGGEIGFVATQVQQQVDTQLPLPPACTMIPEGNPCVGATVGACQIPGVFESAVTKRQVETHDRGQLDIVHALVLFRRGLRVHLAFQNKSN